VVVGEEAHPTLFKALGLAGFGRNRVVRVPVDKQGRMRVDVFPNLSGPTIVCLQAGNVNTGAFDPASELIPKAKAAGSWVHVDGAFGLWAAVAPSTAHLLAGYAGADSWATDAHKYLNTPYDSGLAFVRYPDVLQAAMAVSAAYLPSSSARDPANFTPELSRRARGIEV
jgi:glutamate/tyrosine decarboxylase-like PLP-dependent enzyme